MSESLSRIGYGGAPRYLAGGGVGLVLVHGLTGSPVTVYWMGEYLNERGLTVHIPRLSGHGTVPSDLYHHKWEDWYHDVLAAYLMLRESCLKVFVAGLSMGGALTLTLGANEQPDGLIVLSAPHTIHNRLSSFVPFLKHFTKQYKKASSNSEESKKITEYIDAIKRERGEPLIKEEACYDHWILPAVDQTNRLLQEMHSSLDRVKAPVLFIHSRRDRIVPFSDAEANFKQVGSDEKQLVDFEHSTHVLTRSFEMEKVWEVTYRFIAEHAED